MQRIPALYGVIGVSVALAAIPAGAQSGTDLLEQLKIMRQQLEEQRARVDELERQLRASGVVAPANAAAAAPSQLERMRGTGNLPAPQPGDPLQAQAAPAVPLAQPVYPSRLAPLRGTGGALADAGQAQGDAAVGRPPAPRAPEVAPIFETPGVLTPRGKVVFEPSVQYGYSSSNRVALVGYTVIPALLIGLLDVREVKRNTTTATATFRYGVDNRLEIEAKIPYVYRSDSTVSRELFTGTAAERAFETSGKGIGDIELGWRYQLNDGGVDTPYYIAGLRFKSRTGRDPFQVITDCQTRCVGQNVTGTGLPLDLPTGSGFYSVQPSLTWLLPSDPAIFFGGFSYTKNFKRGNVYRTVLNGDRELLGEIDPGDVFGFNFGMGLALNEKASFSIGYDHNSVGRMHQNGVVIPGSVRVQLGTLLLGYSYRMKNNRTLSVSVGAGLTRDTPDVTLMVRMPFTF
ncbi:acetate kinase [Massilia luteola]|uniref:acetate kinase n=1 Tax=Massilia luteola TaxID=3081751 RepID=UPI002ACBF7C6|nr:acetate kinase [Massilia sp. Gc5]